MTRLFLLILVLAFVHVLAGCGGRCTQGATQACVCAGGVTGVQTCNAENALGACDCGQLSDAVARRLVEGQSDFTDGVTCGVEFYEFAHGEVRIPKGTNFSTDCGRALERAGFGTLGVCDDQFCSSVPFTPSATVHTEGHYLRFRCGSVRLLGVNGVTTTGSTAAFRYEREVTLDRAIVDSVSACPLDIATEGRAQRDRTARRDDAGNWSLVTATR